MKISWLELAGLIAIISSLVGFTLAGPGDVRGIAQAVFYIVAASFFFLLFRRIWPRKHKDMSS